MQECHEVIDQWPPCTRQYSTLQSRFPLTI